MFLFGSLGCSLLPESSDSRSPSQHPGQSLANHSKSEHGNSLEKPGRDPNCTITNCSYCSPGTTEPYPPLWGSARAFYYRSGAAAESSSATTSENCSGLQADPAVQPQAMTTDALQTVRMTEAVAESDIPRLRLEVAPGRCRRSLTVRRLSRPVARLRTGSTSRCRRPTDISVLNSQWTDDSVAVACPNKEFGIMNYSSGWRRHGAADVALATYRSATSAPSRQNSLSSYDSSVSDRSPVSVRSEHSAPCTTGKRFNLPLLRLPSNIAINGGAYGSLGPPRGHHRSFLAVNPSGRTTDGLSAEFCLAEGLLKLQKFLNETFPKVLERHRCSPALPSGQSDVCSSPVDPPSAQLLDFLKDNTNISMIAADFDLTMTTKHSGGVIDKADPKGIMDKLSAEFNNFAFLANEKNLRVACVTFSDEKTVEGQSNRLAGAPLVEAVMLKGEAKFRVEKVYGYFPMLYQQKENYKALGLSSPMPYYKTYHLSRLCADFSLAPHEVLLIDDDVHNCRQAVAEGYLALGIKGRRGFDCKDLFTVI
eukprot:Selendium_serpulae@DN5357_c0_g1_i1.p1